MTLLVRLLSVLVISTSLFVAGCSSGGSSAGFEKDDIDGDGIADIYDPDIDGDGIPNGSDSDIDGDGIPNDQDPDMDGDGKPNGKDPDPENNDPNYCDRIQVFGLNEEQTTGSEIELTWKFFNSNVPNGQCTLKDGVKAGLKQITASATGAANTRSGKTNPLANDEVTIQIPSACTGETVEVTYDFTEIATLIKADPKAAGWKVTQRHRADPDRCDLDGDDLPDFGSAACSINDQDIKNAVNDYIAGGGNGNYVEDSKFANCGLIGTWDVSQVTNMKSLFEGKSNFNEDISNWNVSNVTDMQNMFVCAGFNQDISGWDVSNVRDMGLMFAQLCGARKNTFNQDINGWDVSNVREMGLMFRGNEVFNQPLGAWDVRSVVSDYEMMGMFYGASSFDQDLSGWCVRNIGSKPDYFDRESNKDFKDNAEKQPNWGTCGAPHASDETDSDNDGIPNDSDPDVDGDGTPNTSDNDIDGDGIWNKDDPDIDGDGKTNGIDPDADGDGTPDAEDDTPGGPQ